MEKDATHFFLGGLESGMVVEEVEAKVNDAAGRRFTADEDMGFWQVPAPRLNKELGDLVVELVDPVPGLVMVPFTASLRLTWPLIRFSQLGESASSKSAFRKNTRPS